MKCPKCKSDITAGVKKCPVCGAGISYKVKAITNEITPVVIEEKVTEAIDLGDYLETFQLEETLKEMISATEKLAELEKEEASIDKLKTTEAYAPPEAPEFKSPGEGMPAFDPPVIDKNYGLWAALRTVSVSIAASVGTNKIIDFIGPPIMDFFNKTAEEISRRLKISDIICIVFFFAVALLWGYAVEWGRYSDRKKEIDEYTEKYNKEKEKYTRDFLDAKENFEFQKELYERELAEYKEDYNRREIERKERYHSEKSRISTEIAVCSYNLDLLYKNVNIPDEYHNLTALKAFYGYISSGSCKSLEGENGAIAHYEINGK